MLYKSTRGGGRFVSASEAIIKGIAEDGGLYVPDKFPKITKSFDELSRMTYQQLAYYILEMFLDDFSKDELLECISKAYDTKFDTPAIAPLVHKSGVYFLELYHGRTLAFKDMALSILPYFMKTASKKLGIKEEIVILTATSGDTGKAALEGFSGIEGTKVIVFYPKDGVSEIQRLQMVTQQGDNTFIAALEGNFDDAQNGVKELFADTEFNKELKSRGVLLSSANSINIGRLLPQIVYYVYAYATLYREKRIKNLEEINVVVPTGNFGNILAAFYAKMMGVPLGTLVCASNENKVLTDFMNDGVYDRRREFLQTNSPSMDILISSNLERLLYEIHERNGQKVQELMSNLRNFGYYTLQERAKEANKFLYGNYATQQQTLEAILKVFEESGYSIDTHTAVAYHVYEKYKQETYDERVTLITSTASPFKFPRSMNDALHFADSSQNELVIAEALAAKIGLKMPRELKDLKVKEIRHKTVCKKGQMKETVKSFLEM